MTEPSIERAHAEHLMAAFAVVLTHPAGFGIDLISELQIEPYGDGQFRVVQRDSGGAAVVEEIFDDVRSAVSYYLDLRDELKLGWDYNPHG